MYSAVGRRMVTVLPEITVSSKKANRTISKLGKIFSSPYNNRLILGLTAILTQPFIDLYNKKVDEDTRKVSAARTVAKIIAGTTTGYLVRYACVKAIDAFTKLPSEITDGTKNPRLKTLFTPSNKYLRNLKNLTRYKYAFGNLMALVVMVFTNFLIDAPLTKFLTNFLIDAPLTKFLTNKFVDKIHKKESVNTKSSVSSSEISLSKKGEGVNNVA